MPFCSWQLVRVYGNWFADVDWDPNKTSASLKDWEWYINDKLFKPDGDLEHLNQAAQIASLDLNDPDYKVKLVLMIPGISWSKTNFGTLNGRQLNMKVKEDRDYLIDWYIDTVCEKFEAGNYDYIDFSGFYWFDESIAYSPDAAVYAGTKVHERDMHFFWIPYFGTTGGHWDEAFGIDATAIQPNHYFGEGYLKNDKGYIGNDRVKNTARLASYGQVGIEMEVDGGAARTVENANKFIDYLNGSIDYGFGGPDVYRNWYVGGYGGLASFAISDKAEARNIYDSCYQLMKGTLTEKIPYVTEFHDATPVDPIAPGGSSGGGSIGGGSGSGGGGSVTPKPDDKPDPETPPTGDENYTWEETEDGYKLKDADGEYVTGWAKVSGKWYYLNADGIRTTGWQKVDNNLVLSEVRRRDGDRLAQTGQHLVLPERRRRNADRLALQWRCLVLPLQLGRHGQLRLGTGRQYLVLFQRQRHYDDRLAPAGYHLVLPERQRSHGDQLELDRKQMLLL